MKYFDPPNKQVDFNSISIENLKSSPYIKPISVYYQEGSLKKKWDIVKSKDSVAILIFDNSKNAFVLVRQFRPAVFCNNVGLDGYTYELCAGLVDKDGKSLEEIASEEVFEECGYQVSPQELQKIGTFLSATGINGSMQHLFFAQVSQECKIHQGGGIEDECLEVLYLKLEESMEFIYDDKISKTSSLFLGIQWYHLNFKDRIV